MIQTNLNIEGFNVILTDTAGLRSKTSDVIEEMGMKMAVEQAN